MAGCAVLATARAEDWPRVMIRSPGLRLKTLDLPSGMRIVLEVDHSRPVAGIATVVDCGSVQDPAGKEGLAHLVEHLTFRAKHNGKLQMSNSLELAGAGRWNGFTTHDLTTYVEVGPREALPALLALEGARLSEPLAGIDEDVFEAEREVVRNELNQRDESGDVTAARVTLGADLYPSGHPYARPVSGTGASLWAIALADAQRFAEQCYQPRNYTVVISGDFDHASMTTALDRAFPKQFLDAPASGPVPIRRRMLKSTSPPPDPPSASDVHWVKAQSDAPKLYIGWTLPQGLDSDGYAQAFLSSALGALARHGALGSDILTATTVLSQGKLGSTLVCILVLKDGRDPKRSAAHVLDELSRLWRLSGRGIEMLRAYALVNLARTTEVIEERLVARAEVVHLTGDVLAYQHEQAALQALTRNQVESLAWDWLTSRRARVVFLLPDEPDPEEREVGGFPRVFAPSDDVAVRLDPAALNTFLHPPAAEMRSVMLSSGLELVLVRRSGATASVVVALKSGHATARPRGVTRVASVMTRTSGGLFPASDWGMAFDSTSEPETTMVEISGGNGNLANALSIVLGYLKTIKTEDALPSTLEKDGVPLLRELEQKSAARAQRAFFDNVFADAPSPRAATADELHRVTANDVRQWVDRTYRPSNAVAVVVGDADLAELEKLARTAFEQWKGSESSTAEPVPPPPAPRPAGPVRVYRVERAAAKQTEVVLGCAPQPNDPADVAALRLLAARLRYRLGSFARGRSAGSYGFSQAVRLGRTTSYVAVSGRVDDRNLTRVLALARKDLDELGGLQVSEDELGRLKWRLGLASTVGDGGSLALGALVARTRAMGMPLTFVEKYPELLVSATPQDVGRMATACRATATLGLVGELAVIDKALKATERSGPADSAPTGPSGP